MFPSKDLDEQFPDKEIAMKVATDYGAEFGEEDEDDDKPLIFYNELIKDQKLYDAIWWLMSEQGYALVTTLKENAMLFHPDIQGEDLAKTSHLN